MKFVRYIIPIAIIMAVIVSCASSRTVLSNNVDISKYKYVIFGNESSGDRELDDISMEVQNHIASTDLIVLSSSESINKVECFDCILSPSIHITTEKWDGGQTYITITFYDYVSGQRIAVVKSSGIGLTVSHDQDIALSAIKEELDKLFKKQPSFYYYYQN